MRIALLLLASGSLFLSGCSSLIIGSGKRLDTLTNQDEVHQAFGEPQTTSRQEDGKTVEIFKTHRKIAEPQKGIYLATGYVMTLGFGEFVWFPHQAFIAARRSIMGQEIQFVFDDTGRIVAATHEGTPVFGLPRNEPTRDP